MRAVILHNAVASDASPSDRDVLVQVDAVREGLASLGLETVVLSCTLDLESLRRELLACGPDVVFNLVESLGGCDGLMHLATSLLDAMGIPYTGSPTGALLLSGNKLLAKSRLVEAGLPTPAWMPPAGDVAAGAGALRPPRFPGRFLLKTVQEHASFGLDDSCLEGIEDAATLQERLARHAARIGRPCFAEAYVDGREFNLSLLAGPHGPEVLPPAEIDFSAFPADKPRIVDYRAKWEEDSFEFRHTPRTFDLPASDQTLLEQLAELARRCWPVFGLRGYARVDFRVDSQGQPWILEVNANPCLAPDAGLAAALQRAGIPFQEAIRRIVNEALLQPLTEPASRGVHPRASSGAGMNPAARASVCSRPSAGPSRNAGVGQISFRCQPEPGDALRVRQIVASTSFFNPAELDVAVELVEERLERGQKSGYYFVFAEVGGTTCGYACYGPIAGTAVSYDLFWIAVHRDWQKHGLGKLLLGETERRIGEQGGGRVYAETSGRGEYAPTRAFYERCGYRLEARLQDFYAPGDDKCVYVKVL